MRKSAQAFRLCWPIIERSDAYAELPWKAFALGASGAGLLVLIMNMLWPLTSSLQAALLAIVIMLAAGAGLALLSVFVPDFARLFLLHTVPRWKPGNTPSPFFCMNFLPPGSAGRFYCWSASLNGGLLCFPMSGLNQKINQDAADKIIRAHAHLSESGPNCAGAGGRIEKAGRMISCCPILS